ncbi:hypothetical protein JL721_2371 [Aureococcus anophagefferens]|nr:hypothetical protein JL721_2371 [Aureococcus anophagefferens]
MGSAASSSEEKYAPSADEEAEHVPGGDEDYDEDLVAAVRDQAWVLRYDFETATAESLAAAVAAKIEALGGAVDTIALVNHGPPEAGAWAIAKALEIPVDGAKFDAGGAAAPLLRAIAGAKGLRRVDLLACDIAATPNGVTLVEQLEKAPASTSRRART